MIVFLYIILIAIAAFWALVILTVIIVSIHTRLTTTKEEREALKAVVRKELEEERKRERQALRHAKPIDNQDQNAIMAATLAACKHRNARDENKLVGIFGHYRRRSGLSVNALQADANADGLNHSDCDCSISDDLHIFLHTVTLFFEFT